jgi:hypothetical protein
VKALAVAGKPGRYTLVATLNIFNFVLLDQEDGRAWQVQWSPDSEKRFIEAIH